MQWKAYKSRETKFFDCTFTVSDSMARITAQFTGQFTIKPTYYHENKKRDCKQLVTTIHR